MPIFPVIKHSGYCCLFSMP